MKKINFLTAFLLGGSFIAYSVGASFGSGQDMIQWFGSYGTIGILGYILNSALVCTFVLMVMFDCGKYHLTDSLEVFSHYCGKYLGMVFHIYAILLIAGMTAMLISGAGATLAQYYGLPTMAGRILMTLLVTVTIIFGLHRMISTIAFIGPAIVIVVALVGVVSILNGQYSIAEGNVMMQQNTDVIRAGSSWFSASILYLTYCLILQIPYLAGLSSSTKGSKLEIAAGFSIGAGGIALCGSLVIAGYLRNVDIVAGSQVPILSLGMQFSPVIGIIFGIILLLAMYTTAAPAAWGSVTALVKEENRWYKPAVVIFCAAMLLFSGVAPFANLANWLSTVSGYVGILFLVPFFYTKLIRRPEVPDKAVKAEMPDTISA